MRCSTLLFFAGWAVFLGTARAEGQASSPVVPPTALSTQATPTNARSLLAEEVLVELTRDLAAHFNFEGELKLELVRPWTPPVRLASVWQVSVLEYPTAPASSMLMRCRVIGDAIAVSETTLVVRASLWRDVWLARQPLIAGTTFDPSLLDVRRVDLFRERDLLPAAVGDRSYIFSRAVSAGRLLSWRDVARRPLVRKGNLVEVSVADGLLVVTMKALAMESGAQGETITVRNPESRKDFAAVVVDENRVQVRL